MDLNALKLDGEETAWLHLANPVDGILLYADEPDEKGKQHEPMRILCYGADSKVYRGHEHRAKNARFKQMGRQRGNRLQLTSEGLEEDATSILCACVANWENLLISGHIFPYAPTNTRGLLETYPWIREQVDGFIEDRSNFLGEVSTPSLSTPNPTSSPSE